MHIMKIFRGLNFYENDFDEITKSLRPSSVHPLNKENFMKSYKPLHLALNYSDREKAVIMHCSLWHC